MEIEMEGFFIRALLLDFKDFLNKLSSPTIFSKATHVT